jgi:2'-5' RNA ligase
VSHSVRAFVAIHPGPDLVQTLARCQHEWRQAVSSRSARWVPERQIHLTLRFLGNVPLEAISQLRLRLEQSASAFNPFAVQVHGLGCFPSPDRPRILWAGLDGELGRLHSLHAAIAAATGGLGDAEDESHFTPHLTLARIKSADRAAGRQVRDLLARPPALGPLPWCVNRFALMQSVLAPDGAGHSLLATFPLALPPSEPVPKMKIPFDDR